MLEKELIIEFSPSFIGNYLFELFVSDEDGYLDIKIPPGSRYSREEKKCGTYQMNNDEINGFHKLCEESR